MKRSDVGNGKIDNVLVDKKLKVGNTGNSEADLNQKENNLKDNEKVTSTDEPKTIDKTEKETEIEVDKILGSEDSKTTDDVAEDPKAADIAAKLIGLLKDGFVKREGRAPDDSEMCQLLGELSEERVAELMP